MRKSSYFILFLFSFTVVSVHAQTKSKPINVVVILADDLGWTDLTCYGSSFYETPNLDKLAKRGTRFTKAYATCPVCSPTRSSLMTGKYPVKTGVTDWIRGRQAEGKAKPFEKLIGPPTAYQLALEEKTIAEVALENGYKTFIAGKWHLGEDEKFWPEHQGFQINKGGWSAGSPSGRINDSTGGYFTPYKNPRLSDGPAGEYLTDRLTNECIDFIKNNREHPFLLVHALYAVHNPMQAPSALIKKYQEKQKKVAAPGKDIFAKDERWMNNEKDWKRRTIQNNPVYAAMVENMDWNIGRIMETLRLAGLDDNTLVIFTSDNGGLSTAEGSPTTNYPLRAGKGWLYEGGIRVPLIMYWKGKIVSGLTSEIPVTTADLFPTIAKAINISYKKDSRLDGDDILPKLSTAGVYKNRELFWHYPHYSNQGGKPGSAILDGNYKLIYNYEDELVELYNLATDVGEKNNIATANSLIVERMKRSLFEWLKENHAITPTKNPEYKP